MAAIWIPWVMLAVTVLVVLFFAWSFVAFFSDERATSRVYKFIITVSMTISLLTTVLIPVDIYNINKSVDADYENYSKTIRIGYFIIYSVLFGIGLFVVPIVYLLENDPAEPTASGNRLFRSLKFAAIFLGLITVLSVLSILLGYVHEPENLHSPQLWVQGVFEQLDKEQRAAGFIGCVLSIMGLPFWSLCTSCGLAFIPVTLFFRRKTNELAIQEIGEEQSRENDAIVSIISKAETKGGKLSKAEKKKLQQHEQTIKLLSTRAEVLNADMDWLSRFFLTIKPATRVFSVILLGCGLVFVATAFAAWLDCIAKSGVCTYSGGYSHLKSGFYNLVDEALTELSKFYPMDYILLLTLVVFTGAASVAGISRLALSVTQYRLLRNQTAPQGLMIVCSLLSLCIASLSYELVYIIPKYTTFGSQNCDLSKVTLPLQSSACRMSEISKLVYMSVQSVPILGALYYWNIAVFVVSFLICLAVFGFSDHTTAFTKFEGNERVSLLRNERGMP